MKTIIYLLASRYLWNSKKEHTICAMMLIAGMSIFIGAFSLALVTAIMNGFEYCVHEKMQNIHPQATIYSYRDPIAVDAVQEVISTEFPEIVAMSPQAIGHVLVSGINEEDMPTVAMLKGINPDKETLVSAIGSKLSNSSQFAEDLYNNKIIIGKELARQLDLAPGDRISLLYIEPPEGTQRKVIFEHTDAIIGNTFETGIDEYDSGVIYCSFSFFEKIFPHLGITHIGLSCKSTVTTHTVKKLQQRLGLEVRTWQELYPALVSALMLEKYAMFFILSLITLVASMNIIALIFMLISYKKSDIALLRALGMQSTHIQYLFIMIGVGLSCIASSCGIIGAWIASLLLEQYPFIQLPDAYYVSHLPSRMTLFIGVTVFILVLLISLIASWFATRRIKSINISHVLRFEG